MFTEQETVEPFDVIEWLESDVLNTDGVHLKPHDIGNVLYFGLVWNVFEDELVGAKNNATIGKTESLTLVKIKGAVEDLYRKGSLKTNHFDELLVRIKKRYVSGGNLNTNFKFHFRPVEADAEQLLKEVLLGTKTEVNDVLFGLLSIAWRLRNNLFHGIKYVSELKEQNDNFGAINEVLATFLRIKRR